MFSNNQSFNGTFGHSHFQASFIPPNLQHSNYLRSFNTNSTRITTHIPSFERITQSSADFIGKHRQDHKSLGDFHHLSGSRIGNGRFSVDEVFNSFIPSKGFIENKSKDSKTAETIEFNKTLAGPTNGDINRIPGKTSHAVPLDQKTNLDLSAKGIFEHQS